MKVDDNMKLHIKEQLRKISYPETTDFKLPSEPVKTKGSPRKVKPTQSDKSMRRFLSYFEHVGSHFPDSPTPKSQKSIFKDARISKPSLPPPIPKIKFIEKMSLFMQNYIKRIINVESNDNCDF